jgi:hypothetical protein
MTDADKKDFGVALGALGFAFGAKIDNPTLDAYWHFLSDLDLGDFKRAVTAAGKTLKWFPKPAELRDLAEGPKRITAAMQWANVRKMMDKIDIYGSPDFGPLVNAVLHALGGWKSLCDRTIPELVWIQKDFERLCVDYANKDLSCLRTDGHIGEFGKPPEWCALEGTPRPQKQLASPAANQISDFVRELAESKSLK